MMKIYYILWVKLKLIKLAKRDFHLCGLHLDGEIVLVSSRMKDVKYVFSEIFTY